MFFKDKQARLAQSVERQALNLVVGGSSPPVGASLFLFLLLFQYIGINLFVSLFIIFYNNHTRLLTYWIPWKPIQRIGI